MIDRKQKILFVDDDINMLTLVKTFLEKAGFQCVCAQSGSDGLDLVLKEKPNLILLDYMMPGLDGGQVYAELTTNPVYQDFKNIPVIILTAKESDEILKAKFLEGGVSAYLQKPFGLQELIGVIDNVFIVNEIKAKNLRLQAEIHQTKEYLELLFDSIPIGILTCNADGIIRRVNSYLLKIIKIDNFKSILGKSIFSFDLVNASPIVDELMETFATGKPLLVDSLNYVTPNSTRITVKLKAISFSDRRGVIFLVEDITETERKERELAMLSQIRQFMHGMFQLNELLHLILTAITAGCALGFSRAMILLINQKNHLLEGRMGVGPANQQEANRIWSELAKEDISLPTFLKKYGIKISHDDTYFNSLVKQIKKPLDQLDSIFSKVIKKNVPVKIKHSQAECTLFSEKFHMDEFIAVPLVAKDKVIGVVVADNQFSNRPIDEHMIELLMLFSSQAGLAIERAEAYHELEEEKNKLEKAYKVLKNTQDRLIHAERLATVGKMAAQIAHEVRNPLVAIGGFARNISKLITTDPQNSNIGSHATIIADEVSRLENILSNVLNFSKLSSPEVRLENINKIIEDVCLIINIRDEVSEHGINVKTKLDHSIPLSLMDSQQIKQVLINLCENALHSMKKGGELFLSTKKWMLSKLKCRPIFQIDHACRYLA